MKELEKSDQSFKRVASVLQMLFWLILVFGLGVLPLLASSQLQHMRQTHRTNHWLQNYSRAMHDYRTGNYLHAYERFRSLADVGSTGAQTMIGHLYWTGKGVEQTYGKAFMWFHRAAARGYAPAQLATGRAYARGYGIEQNKINAALWLSLADSRGTTTLQTQAHRELLAIMTSLSPAEQKRVEYLKQQWRPDVALKPQT
jgi:TPR repeat protein